MSVEIVRLVAMIFVMMFVMSDGKKDVKSVIYRCQGNEKSKSFSSLPILSELRKYLLNIIIEIVFFKSRVSDTCDDHDERRARIRGFRGRGGDDCGCVCGCRGCVRDDWCVRDGDQPDGDL